MTVKDLFDAGQLTDAIEQLVQEVKAAPADARRRTFLFELLCFAGEYDRAERQLDALRSDDVKVDMGLDEFRHVLVAERARQKLFSDGQRPTFLREPPPGTALHLEALDRLRDNRPEEARALLDEAVEAGEPLSGTIDGDRFAEFHDADGTIGSFLELYVGDKYAWLPFQQIRSIEIPTPKRLRDLLWTSATVESRDGTVGAVYLPVLYAASSGHPDGEVRLGRMTAWKQIARDFYMGCGQRLFAVDGEERGMLELRRIEFD